MPYRRLPVGRLKAGAASDLNSSGLVDIEDYFLLASRWYQQGDAE